MNFQQLRIIREAVRHDFNLTEVADALFTSQSGVSKHIKDLEHELGLQLFVRHGKRLVGLTGPGRELVPIVERMLLDVQNIKRLADAFSGREDGQLRVATTHTQARYTLPGIVSAFRAAFPEVELVLYQGNAAEIVSLLLDGSADLGIATEGLHDAPALATFPYLSWRHTVVVPRGHPLDGKRTLAITDLADLPIVTYHEGYTGRARIDEAFARAEIVPNIVVSALDADVIKRYVELGLGVGIMASLAFDPERDRGLRQLSSEDLFEPNISRIAVRRGSYLRSFAYRFIELCAPDLTEAIVKDASGPGQA